MVIFEPLNMDGRNRSAVYHAARLSMLHARLAKKLEQIDQAADEVEQAAAELIEVTRGAAVEAFRDAVFSGSSTDFPRLDSGQTLGL